MKKWCALGLALFFGILAYWIWPRMESAEVGSETVTEGELRQVFKPESTPEMQGNDLAPPRVSALPPVSRPAKHAEKSLSPEEIRKARSEMKVGLAAIYGAQQSFFAEYGRYSTDLRAIGYWPEDRSAHYAKFGFLSPYSPREPLPAEDPRNLDSDSYFSTEANLRYRPNTDEINLADYGSFCRQGCTVDGARFEIMMVAPLVEGNPPDIWIINERKELIHAQDGTQQNGHPGKR